MTSDGTGRLGDVNEALDPGNATMVETAYPITGAVLVGAKVGGASVGSTLISPPKGSRFTAGATYSTVLNPDPTHAGLDVVAGESACGSTHGTLTVNEVAFDATGLVTALAAHWTMTCDGDAGGYHGEIRFHSSMAWSGVILRPTDFGTNDVYALGGVRALTVEARGPDPVRFGSATLAGSSPQAFRLRGSTCAGAVRSNGQQCAISVDTYPTAMNVQRAELVLGSGPTGESILAGLQVTGKISRRGTFRDVPPARILDTRVGAPKVPLGPRGVLQLAVAGRGGVPAAGVSAVVMNLTVTGTTANGYVVAYPSGAVRPLVSSLNFPPGWTGANLVTVPLGANGAIDVFNDAGQAHVIGDVVGYYAATDAAAMPTNALFSSGAYHYLTPQRILDTRASGGSPVSSRGSLPVTHDLLRLSTDVLVNITATGATADGYLTVGSGSTSTLNFARGSTVSNTAIVPTGADPMSFEIHNLSNGTVNIIVDVIGYFAYPDGANGEMRFRPIAPARIVDTRQGMGANRLAAATTRTVIAPSSVMAPDTRALVINLTAVRPTTSTFLTLWAADGSAKPPTSNLNPVAGQILAGSTIAGLGSGHALNIYNSAGATDLLVDVTGTFEAFPPTPAP